MKVNKIVMMIVYIKFFIHITNAIQFSVQSGTTLNI